MKSESLSEAIKDLGTGAYSRARNWSAIGALALGALAIGTLAIGVVAVGRLVVGRAKIRRLEIDELVVRRLRITDSFEPPNARQTPRSSIN